ncbi:MAG: aldehyde dehydrogenase family protein [Acidimicrobiia bacterium]
MSEVLYDEPRDIPRARMMLQRAQWAAAAFASYPHAAVARIAESVARAAYENAERYAEWAVRETGMGVAEDKRIKNEACSQGILDAYRGRDWASPRPDPARKIISVPRPAGVVFALTPSTNPISTLYFKVLIALMTRNAIVVSPHPMAKECSAGAARLLSAAAIGAGAPAGCVQVIEEPNVPLIEALMADKLTNVIVATGGLAVVRAANKSGNPTLAVGPGNIPSFVDATADVARAARQIVDSKSFDNSVLCTNESVLVAHDAIAEELTDNLRRSGAYVCKPDETERVRDKLFDNGRMRVDLVGRDADILAQEAGIAVPKGTRIIVAPFSHVVPEEPLAHEKLYPLLGMVRVSDATRGIDAAHAVTRIAGAGHSAAIHSSDHENVVAYGAAVNVLRVVVNAGASMALAGFGTDLAPSMTVGTGFFGGSSTGENLTPDDLVNWTRIAYPTDAAARVEPSERVRPAGPPIARVADERPRGPAPDVLRRDELRQLVLKELREFVRSG